MKNRLKAKIKRKYNQRLRVCKMYLLLKAYEMFHMMQLHTECVKASLSYEEAESFSSLMNEIFMSDTTADTFIMNPDEESDKAIDCYNNLQSILDGCSDVLKQSIMAFCKNVYFGNSIPRLKVEGFLFYPYYLENVLNYIDGVIDASSLRNSIVIMRPWQRKLKKTDSCKFRHDFMKAEQLFDTIFLKKTYRSNAF